jgi:uncharacterized membrane protein YjdF
MKNKSYILIIFLAVMSAIIFFKYQTGWIKDFISIIILIVALYLLYAKLRITPLAFAFICSALIVHSLGAFGFYAKTPIFFNIPYDTLTHFLSTFAATILVADFLSFSLTKSKKFKFNDFIVLLLVFLAALGIGALFETMEFTGYLAWGHGQGFFQFGSGDYGNLYNADLLTQIVGGGYFDTMKDLMINMVGALVGVILSWFNFFILKREEI